MRLLETKESNLTPIFVVGSAGLQIMMLFVLILVLGKVGQIASTKPPTLVELSDGKSVRVSAIGSSERSPQAISNFVAQTLSGLMNWNATLPVEEYLAQKPQLDPGIKVGDYKVTTATWNAAFGLSEDFREAFLKEIAALTPQNVFSGRTQAVLITRYISEPESLGEGRWKVDVIANVVAFSGDRLGKAIAFNKSVYVRAVDTPLLTPKASDLEKTVYKARSAGLEVYKIKDFEAGK